MKKLISLILAAVMLVSATILTHAENAPFTDVKANAWYAEAVGEVYEAGIMEGKGDGKFAPNASMTRAELVTVLCRLSGDNAEGMGENLTFTDTKKSAWYADSVAWAVESGIVAGYEDNTFKPNKAILRQELAKMFVAFLEYMSLPLEGTALTDSFADSSAFPKWAAEYIETLRKTGLMGGDTAGNFRPKANASRAEIATVITRLLPRIVSDSIVLFENGKTDYTIVYDDSDITLSRYIIDLVKRLRLDMSVGITSVKASSAEADYGREIIIGNVREKGQQLTASLESEGDFEICFMGDDLVLATNDTSLYPYLLKVLETQVFSGIKDRGLTVDASYSFRYSESSVYGKAYEQYVVDTLKAGGDISQREMQGLFTYEHYEDYGMNYRLYVPAYYDETKDYPVLLFLHGAGESGDDNDIQLNTMMTAMFNQDNALLTESIVIAPQSDGYGWIPSALKGLLDSVCDTYSADLDRIYVMGYSMGGFGSFDMITSYTDTFAAAVPICSGASASDAYKLVDFPLYIVHGAKDNVVPVSASRTIVNALKQLGSTSVIYEELPNYSHNTWGYTANKPEILEWLFEQRLSYRG